jgi:3-oxoacyl-[acyl-carrier protein] reductase
MLSQDVGPRGVRVNVVSPGYVETQDSGASEEERCTVAANTALRRLALPKDVADAVLFFASDLSAFVTGQCLQVNGGG